MQLLVQGLTLIVLTVQLVAVQPAPGADHAGHRRARHAPHDACGSSGRLIAATSPCATRIANVLADLSESLSGIRLVVGPQPPAPEHRVHTNIVGDYHDANIYTAKVAAIYGPGPRRWATSATLLVLLIGGHMVLQGKMHVGELTGFALALTAFFAPIQQLAQLYNTYQQGNAGLVQAPRPPGRSSRRCPRHPTPTNFRRSRAGSTSTT